MADEKELLDKIKSQTEKQLEDVNSRIEEITKGYKETVEKAVDGLLSKKELEQSLKELTEKAVGFTPEQAKQITDDLNKLGVEIQSLKENKIKSETGKKTFRDIIEDGLKEAGLISVKKASDGEDEVKQITYLRDKGAKTTPLIELKAAVDMTTALSYGSVEVGSPFKTVYDPTLVSIPLNNDIHTTQIFPVMNIGTKYMGILVEYTYTDGSATTDENTASGLSSVLFKTEEFKAFKINTHFHISEEQLDDVDYLLDELSRLAPDKILTKWDSKVLSASGDGSTDIKGLFVAGNHTAFAAATYAATVENPTVIDLIGKMKLQANLTNFNPNVVILHPSKIDEIEGLKDLNENSLYNRTVKYDMNGNLAFVKGLRVIANKNMGTNTVFVGSSEAAKIGIRKDMNMVIGLDSDDLTTGMRTVVFSFRGAFGVRNAEAMIYEDDVTTTLTTIAKA